MRNLTHELNKKTLSIEKLEQYGFIKINNIFQYEKVLENNNFKTIIEVSLTNEMTSKVVEISNNEEYILVDVPTAKGEFVGKLKEEYEKIINDVIEKCTTYNVFKNKQSLEVIKYIKDKYNDELEFLWKKFDDNAIWRNKKNSKWYAALLTITEDKLGLSSNNKIEIIDLMYQKDKIEEIIDNQLIFPGYHMNKKSWITIKLDNSVDIEYIYKLIDNSYEISLRK